MTTQTDAAALDSVAGFDEAKSGAERAARVIADYNATIAAFEELSRICDAELRRRRRAAHVSDIAPT